MISEATETTIFAFVYDLPLMIINIILETREMYIKSQQITYVVIVYFYSKDPKILIILSLQLHFSSKYCSFIKKKN
jgi:hypothetical protein